MASIMIIKNVNTPTGESEQERSHCSSESRLCTDSHLCDEPENKTNKRNCSPSSTPTTIPAESRLFILFGRGNTEVFFWDIWLWWRNHLKNHFSRDYALFSFLFFSCPFPIEPLDPRRTHVQESVDTATIHHAKHIPEFFTIFCQGCKRI